MTPDQWLSLDLPPEHYRTYQDGDFNTVETDGADLFAVPRRVHLRPNYKRVELARKNSPEEAHAVAVILRLLNPK